MASFGVPAVDAGSVAAAAAGLMNATMAAEEAAGAVQLAAGVSAAAVNAMQVAGNISSLIAVLIPIFTYVVPVCRAKGVGARTVYNFLFVFISALLWLLFAIPSKPRSVFTLTVNSLAMAAETFYAAVYLKHAVGDNFKYSSRVVMVAAVIAFSILILIVPLVYIAHIWSVEVIGVTASTFATINFMGGLIDVVIVVRKQRSVFNSFQLMANFLSASIWAAYGFLFRPANKYIVVPNLTGVGVTTAQIIVHARQRWNDRNGRGNN